MRLFGTVYKKTVRKDINYDIQQYFLSFRLPAGYSDPVLSCTLEAEKYRSSHCEPDLLCMGRTGVCIFDAFQHYL